MLNRVSLVILLALFLFLPATLFAQTEHGWPTLGIVAGGYHFGNASGLDGSTTFGVKLGYEINGRNFADRLGIEGVFLHIDADSKLDGSQVDVNVVRLDLLYLFSPLNKAKKIVPFLTFGAGGVFADGDSFSASDPMIAYGFGSKYLLTEALALRADLRQAQVFDDSSRSDYEYTLGLNYRFGVEKKVVPIKDVTDTDKDGIVDSKDQCADTPTDLKVNKAGCPIDPPDLDADGVPDYLDKCPATAEGLSVDKKGCFLDDDGDGVPNERDRCPSNPPGFQVDEQGCTKLIRRSAG